LWNEIITGRHYYNIKQIANDYVKNLTKEDILKFFDKMVNTHMKKLSVQEFSQKADRLPNDTPTVRGYKSKLIKNLDYLRNNKKYLK
jgi:hypothetical protein